MLVSRRCPGPLRLILLLAGLPAVLAAEPIHISGRVLIPGEAVQGLAGARVELLPQTGQTPVSRARSDAAGFFELTALESGCFRVRMRAEGYRNVEAPFLPLAEDQDLMAVPALPSRGALGTQGLEIDERWVFDAPAPVQPSPASPRLVQGKVRDLNGAPVAGALVWSEGDPGVYCVKAGADGSFRIRLPASGEVKLRAARAGYLPSDPRPALGRQDPPLVLALAPAGAIAGRVVDAAGQPLARVQIKATPVPWEGDPPRSWAWSRADGRFRLSRLPPGKLYELAASLDGFAPAAVQADALSSPKPVRIVLERGATVLGKVLDPEGQPVPGAELALLFFHEVITGPGSSSSDTTIVGRAVSDAAGSFVFSHLRVGPFDLRVTGKGFATLSVPRFEVADEAARIDLGALTLDRGAVIEGQVTDPSGAPLPTSQVTLSPAPDPGLSVPGASSGTSTDSEGRFRFEGLHQGARFGLFVERSGFVPARVPAVEAPTPEPLRIELSAGRAVAGRVKSPGGEPVPQAWVVVNSATGFTDPEGRFRLAGLQPGLAEISVDAEGYPRAIQDLQIPEESDIEGLEIALHEESTLEVQVLDSRRQPVAGIQVIAYPQKSVIYWDTDGSVCTTDPEGRCRIGGLGTGPYRVLAQTKTYGWVQSTVEIGPGVNGQDLVLPPAP
jgi:protocatechuate 3,4-dioxygenase beta subunit